MAQIASGGRLVKRTPTVRPSLVTVSPEAVRKLELQPHIVRRPALIRLDHWNDARARTAQINHPTEVGLTIEETIHVKVDADPPIGPSVWSVCPPLSAPIQNAIRSLLLEHEALLGSCPTCRPK